MQRCRGLELILDVNLWSLEIVVKPGFSSKGARGNYKNPIISCKKIISDMNTNNFTSIP